MGENTAKADDNDAVDQLIKLLAAHKRLITEMMLRTENLESAIQLVRQERLTRPEKPDNDAAPPPI